MRQVSRRVVPVPVRTWARKGSALARHRDRWLSPILWALFFQMLVNLRNRWLLHVVVDGASMAPTIAENRHLLVNRRAYRGITTARTRSSVRWCACVRPRSSTSAAPRRGDVLVIAVHWVP